MVGLTVVGAIFAWKTWFEVINAFWEVFSSVRIRRNRSGGLKKLSEEWISLSQSRKDSYLIRLYKQSSYMLPLSTIKKKFFWAPSILQQTECQICLKTFRPGSRCRMFSCFHFFHHECINKWLMKDLSCPHCKGRFDEIKDGDFKKEHFKQKEKNKPELEVRTMYSDQIKRAKMYKVT